MTYYRSDGLGGPSSAEPPKRRLAGPRSGLPKAQLSNSAEAAAATGSLFSGADACADCAGNSTRASFIAWMAWASLC